MDALKLFHFAFRIPLLRQFGKNKNYFHRSKLNELHKNNPDRKTIQSSQLQAKVRWSVFDPSDNVLRKCFFASAGKRLVKTFSDAKVGYQIISHKLGFVKKSD